MSATCLEGAALLLVDDFDAASIRQRQPLRPAPPARRARLRNQLARSIADAGRKLRRPSNGVTSVNLTERATRAEGTGFWPPDSFAIAKPVPVLKSRSGPLLRARTSNYIRRRQTLLDLAFPHNLGG